MVPLYIILCLVRIYFLCKSDTVCINGQDSKCLTGDPFLTKRYLLYEPLKIPNPNYLFTILRGKKLEIIPGNSVRALN